MLVVLASVLGAVGALLISRFGGCLGLIDQPTTRSSHSLGIPKGGGIGLLAALCLIGEKVGFPYWIWLSTAVLALVSLLGDRVEISPKFRLIAQFLAAGTACGQLITISAGVPGWHGREIPIGYILSVIIIVATANVYNFMDGINGIAGITGIVAFGLLAISGWMRGESPAWVLVASALAAACAGFLPWNFPRARVFMGDVGSILLGFVFAFFVVAWSRTLADFIMFASFLFPFYADEGMTVMIRLKNRDSLIKPHRRHVYQILVNQMGIPHWKISLLYGFIQAGVAGVAIWIRPRGWIAEAAWISLSLGMIGVLARRVRRHEV
jgi:UDP-N-acetylmuramyl pentapeptide phosphotransferase/UDP-N-acetylglucosamine-1-phosphate transferase